MKNVVDISCSIYFKWSRGADGRCESHECKNITNQSQYEEELKKMSALLDGFNKQLPTIKQSEFWKVEVATIFCITVAKENGETETEHYRKLLSYAEFQQEVGRLSRIEHTDQNAWLYRRN